MSDVMDPCEATEDGAARWAIRLDSGPLSPQEQSDLDAWLAQDPRRTGALLRAEAALAFLDRGRALGSPDEPEAELPPASQPVSVGRRSVLLGGALAGAVAAGLVGTLFLGTGPERLDTRVGEIRRVPLADGSIATINTASTLEVAMGPDRRRVRLEAGEAWFQVARDPARPFVVQAGKVRVQAVGTAFSVRRRDGAAEILVTQGVVETWVAGREGDRLRIAAGSRGFVAEAAQAIRADPAADEIERALAWRSGGLALNGETVAFAVAEINRYNDRQLVVSDPDLAGKTLVGYFSTNEPEEFGRAVAAVLDARMVEDGRTIRLLPAGS